MHNEQATNEMQNKINELKEMLKAMEFDMSQCARGISPCFFCANDDTCECTGCNGGFKWKPHN